MKGTGEVKLTPGQWTLADQPLCCIFPSCRSGHGAASCHRTRGVCEDSPQGLGRLSLPRRAHWWSPQASYSLEYPCQDGRLSLFLPDFLLLLCIVISWILYSLSYNYFEWTRKEMISLKRRNHKREEVLKVNTSTLSVVNEIDWY